MRGAESVGCGVDIQFAVRVPNSETTLAAATSLRPIRRRSNRRQGEFRGSIPRECGCRRVEHGLRGVVRAPIDDAFFFGREALVRVGANLPANFAHGRDEQHVLVRRAGKNRDTPTCLRVDGVDGLIVSWCALDQRVQVRPVAQVGRAIEKDRSASVERRRSRGSASSRCLLARGRDRESR